MSLSRVKIIWDKFYYLMIEKTDTVGQLREQIIKKLPHFNHYFKLQIANEIMESDKQLSYYFTRYRFRHIRLFYDNNKVGGYIDNLKEESETSIAKKIGFDLNLIKRDELRINLIHFDPNMTNKENYEYFNKFKVDVVGGFYAMDDVNIFQKFLQKISERHIPFLVACSGSSGKVIIPICKQYSFIKEVIIFRKI